MPFLNGINAAKRIRALDNHVKIILFSSSSDYVVESYSIEAFYYFLKPVQKELLHHVLEKAIETLKAQYSDSLLIKVKEGYLRIMLPQLEYCEIIDKHLFFHLANNEVFVGSGTITVTAEYLLKNQSFIRPHRSYIVNMNFIKKLSLKEIILESTTKIPISRNSVSNVRSAYLDYCRCLNQPVL